MKKLPKNESLRKKYFNKLLSDKSVDDAMPIFTRAMRIFQMVKKKKHKAAG